MEHEPQLESRAQLAIAQANEVLTLPDSVRLTQRYYCSLGGDFFLELYSAADTRIGDSTQMKSEHKNLRYIYLTGPHEMGNCRPAFSLDVNMLVGEGEVSGLTDRAGTIQDAISIMPSNLQQERALLLTLVEILQEHAAFAPTDPAKTSAVNTMFTELLDQGATETFKSVRRTNEDGTILVASSVTIEGSLQHAWPLTQEKPRTKIAVLKNGAKDFVVLEESRQGMLESFEEIANPLQRAASYAKDENIIRDEDGKILMVSGSPMDEQAIKSAERAMGIRDLHPDQLAVIEEYVRSTLAA